MSSSARVPLPRPPQDDPPFRVPVIASLAPLAVAAVLWTVTQSPYALLFAALGPVTAAASFADSRLGGRRTARRHRARFDREWDEALTSIRGRHEGVRDSLVERAPSAALIASGFSAAARWRSTVVDPVEVTLGTGQIPSGVELDPPPADCAPVWRERLDGLRSRAAKIAEAPIVADARSGIAVCGPPALATAMARAIALELSWALSPASHWCAGSEEWMEALPHPKGRASRGVAFAEFGAIGTEATARVAVARDGADIPGDYGIVIAVRTGAATIVRHPDREERRSIRPVVVSRETAVDWAQRTGEDAEREGVVRRVTAPRTLALTPLLRGPDPASRALACEFAVGDAGALTVDLVRDGPHAVVGGTTGSGKSELLVSWVIAMAAAAPPESVTFLLVDFKGGSAFHPLVALPHTVGIITDLDASAATRALASLRAEMRHRERELARGRVRSIDELESVPRLVIVVDEFAAMITEHPDLHGLFADIAARGRSLGMHLVLCTQRPAGVVRDVVLANADLRISLRVNNAADSAAVVGTGEASALPASARGAAIIVTAESEPTRVQVALATEADAESVAQRWPGSPPPRRPWCEPLPEVVAREDLTDRPVEPGVIVFGLLDVPEEQRRAVATWRPGDDGHLLVLGTARSGKSGALAAVGEAARHVPADPASAWDALDSLGEASSTTVILDDIDSLLAKLAAEYRDGAIERLGEALRDGPARGLVLVLAAQRLTADLQGLATLIPGRLLLRHLTRQDWLMAGGDGVEYLERLAPGGGAWRGHRVQVVDSPRRIVETPKPRISPLADRLTAIISPRSASLRDRLAAAGREPVTLEAALAGPLPARAVIIGDMEEWQSRWGALGALRPHADILLEGCSIAEFRALTRSRQLPPVLTGLTDVAWRLEEGGAATRVRLPV